MTATSAGRAGRLVDRVAIAAAGAAAGLTFAPAFVGDAGIGLVIPAGVVAATALVPPRRWPLALRSVIVVVLLFCGVVAAMLIVRQPAGIEALRHVAGWQRLGDVLLGGAGRTVRLTLPLPPELVVIPALLSGAAGVVGAMLVQRHPGGLAALVPACAVGVCGIVAAGVQASQAVPVGIGLAGAALLILRGVARSASHAGRREGGFRVVAALVGVLIAGVPLLWLPARPTGAAVDLRDKLRAPKRVVAGASLLDRVAGWISTPSQVLFRADTVAVHSWRLAVLDRYDGDSWASSAEFTSAGLGVPPFAGPIPRTAIEQRVELVGLDGPYLPAADRPIRVSSPVSAVDAADGVLLADRRLAAGTTYRVISLPRAEPARPIRSAAAPGTDDELAVPAPLLDDLRALVRAAPIRAGMLPAERAQAVEWYLRNHRRNVIGAPSDASIPAMWSFLAPGGSGTTVQFAVAFALAMREEGLPARLVVGFLPESTTAAPVTLYGRDAQVWVELKYAREGWVTYRPTPPAVHAGAVLPPPQEPLPTISFASPSAAPPPAPVPRGTRPAPAVLPILLAVLILAAGYLSVVLPAPVVRRAWRRHRRGTTEQRVIRAWHDVLDDLPPDALAGRPLRSMTPMDVFHLVARLDGSSAAANATLTRLADKALFSPEPSTDADGHAAWLSARSVRLAVRQSRSPGERCRTRLHPARLVGRPAHQVAKPRRLPR